MSHNEAFTGVKTAMLLHVPFFASLLLDVMTVKIGKFPFVGIGKASIEDEREGFVKIVGDAKYDEILGVHIIQAHAGEMIAEAVAVLNGEMSAEDLAHTIHPHPTLSEGISEATHAFYGHAIHI